MAGARRPDIVRVTLDDPGRTEPPLCCNCGNRRIQATVRLAGLIIHCGQCHVTEIIEDSLLTAGERQWMAENPGQPD